MSATSNTSSSKRLKIHGSGPGPREQEREYLRRIAEIMNCDFGIPVARFGPKYNTNDAASQVLHVLQNIVQQVLQATGENQLKYMALLAGFKETLAGADESL